METTVKKSDLVEIRDAVPDDAKFIFASWLRGLYYGDTWFGEIDKSVFMENYHKIIESILYNPNTKVKIACLKEYPSAILAYAVLKADGNGIHWVFCKKPWRNIGLAKSLIPATINYSTHATKVGLAIMKKKKIKFNPFII